MDTLLEAAIKGLDLMTQGRNIVWKIAPLPRVLGDAALLKQALTNLVGNAIKYTGQREKAEIEIGCAGMEGDRLIFFVRDNGAGFDMQYAHKLFGVFQRLHRTEEFEGTGIGLAIVRRVINRHGGRVWAEGKLNAGATFYFTLKPAPAA
jgi:light-regulated signal transduction histidine kinase (bacteriophytochrome)